MKSLGSPLSLALALAAVLLAKGAWLPATAALGDTVASIQADQLSLKGQLRVRSEPGYSVQEITAANGTVVREYVSPAGVVFAVSWSGRAMPNLQQTLGTYFTQLQAAVKTQRADHAHRLGHDQLEVRTPELVVHAGGHMRQYFGIAYVPSLLPPNLSISDLH
ncbi:MAG TPA: DUF2844 domain-containing protein [Steroidobacteraceae bacterium]|nr:DUF2844 domain-containing protein [Steroidobacteraceae bacterium]